VLALTNAWDSEFIQIKVGNLRWPTRVISWFNGKVVKASVVGVGWLVVAWSWFSHSCGQVCYQRMHAHSEAEV